jgi:glycogen debranching enzyme
MNALWYHLVAYLARLLSRTGDREGAAAWLELQHRLERSFVDRFWRADCECLVDLWADGEADLAVRPNMIVAAAMELSPLTPAMRVDIVRVAETHLLTPLGLRSRASALLTPVGPGVMPPADPAYRGTHGGGERAHQEALHQGSAWPWLLGFYVEAWLRAVGPDPQVVTALRTLLDDLADELRFGGLNHLSEVYDGDAPHRPGGSFAQAWNDAEILRAYRMLEEAQR